MSEEDKQCIFCKLIKEETKGTLTPIRFSWDNNSVVHNICTKHILELLNKIGEEHYLLEDSTTTDTTLELDEERRKKEQLKKDFTSGDPIDIVLGKGEFTYYPTVEESKLNPMDFFPKSEDMKLVFTSEETTTKSAIEEEEEKDFDSGTMLYITDPYLTTDIQSQLKNKIPPQRPFIIKNQEEEELEK